MSEGAQKTLAFTLNMITPLLNVDNLDKRITDLHTVKQWLELNLSLLQSTNGSGDVAQIGLAREAIQFGDADGRA
ncbi:MAG TPA: PhaM family polyhydroxyalkanoate granule multifunctional regulatory protein [Paraburkholderia sp.]|nr:PhaM family polyhydroxyalkanoate granule multifunctional regulatory protein [Paraburkholderia sp.]